MGNIGVGWPNGATINEDLLGLNCPLLLLSSEHWHVKEVLAAGRPLLYRVVPPLDQRPAKLGWSLSKYVDMLMEQIRGLPITDLVMWNELDLNYERGDDEDDFNNLDERYEKIGDWALEIILELRHRLPGVRLHWPAWTPNRDHQAVEHINKWVVAARNCDVIDFHEYVTLDNIQKEYTAYRAAFPNHPIELTEWHCRGNIEEEQRVIDWLHQVGIRSYFFIYEWHNAPGWWSNDWDIEHDDARYEMFFEANVTELEEPTVPQNPPLHELKAYAHQYCDEKGVHWPTYEKQIQQESGWTHFREDGTIVTSSGGAKGIGQIVPVSHPNANWADPFGNLTYSIDLMAAHVARFGTYRKALAAYNWGPGNVGGYHKDGKLHPAWDGTREWRCPINIAACRVQQRDHYLDVILGPEWKEPNTEIEMPPTTEYIVGPGIAAKMAEHNDEPATHEMPFKHGDEVMYAMAFGKSGAQYVYLPATNSNHRFPAD